jgi:N-acetylglucosaminyldiphosphoundecaprenol N-acetyl-beta-D-mannosaminyltransferase
MSILSEDIVGYPVASVGAAALVAEVMAWIAAPGGSCRYFACINPHAVEVARVDPEFRAALLGADFLVPDGIGIVYASRVLGGRIRERVTGTDVFLATCAAQQAAGGGRCFFLGSTEPTLAAIRARLARDFPALQVVGTLSPPFKPAFSAADSERMVEAVNASGADVLWVGLTAPKQEKWIREQQGRLAVRFAGPIGAAFDFYTGRIRRAGPTLQRLGLEWLPRLLQEPRRLWRRMGISAPRFIGSVIGARLRR